MEWDHQPVLDKVGAHVVAQVQEMSGALRCLSHPAFLKNCLEKLTLVRTWVRLTWTGSIAIYVEEDSTEEQQFSIAKNKCDLS